MVRGTDKHLIPYLNLQDSVSRPRYKSAFELGHGKILQKSTPLKNRFCVISMSAISNVKYFVFFYQLGIFFSVYLFDFL